MVFAITLGLIGWRFRPGRWAHACIGVACILLHPLLGVVGLGSVVVVRRLRSISAQRRAARQRTDDSLLALDLVSLGSTAGLPFLASVSAAADEIAGTTSAELRRAVTRVEAGLPHSLPDGPVSQAFDAAQRSSVSGASLADSLVDLAQEVRAEQASLERERIERLPVKLLFPLAFLILPGFVLVAVVPSIVSGLDQLNF